MGLTGREMGRKSLHMAMGLFALALAVLTPWQAALCAVVAFLHNLFILPRTARFALRDGTLDAGLLSYPLSVLFLILVFWREPAMAAAAWGFLAFGDGMATVIGKSLPLARPSWAGGKSLGGFVAFALFGGAAANLLYNIVGNHDGFAWIFWVAGILLGILELLPMPVNDNVVIPLFSAVLLGLLTGLHAAGFPAVTTLLAALGVNVLLASLSFAAGLVSASAMVGGVLVGSLILGFGGLPSYALLLGFFAIATAATKFGYARKANQGIAQERGGRRGSSHALANCSAGAFLAVLLPFTSQPLALKVALAAAFATALADTLGSELGQLFGKTPIHPLTFRKVPVGTEGAVSLEGTVAGIAGSFLLAALPLVWGFYPSFALLLVAGASLFGSMAESLLGALGEWNNEVLNFVNTVLGAAAGFGLAVLVF